MIWRNVIPKLLLAFLPTLIVPGIVIWLIIKHFSISETSLLGIMALAQIYIIWAQLEIALRQSELQKKEYEPILKVGKRFIGGNGNIFYYIENVGKYLARNVNILIRIMENNQKEKLHEFRQIGNLAPGEKGEIGFLKEWEDKYTIIINVDYEDVFNRMKRTLFVKEPKFSEFFNILPEEKLPGILLNSFEEIGLIFKNLIYFRKFLKKPKKYV